jgi:hypothetical protein
VAVVVPLLLLQTASGNDAGTDTAATDSGDAVLFELDVPADGPTEVERLDVRQGQRVEITVRLGFDSIVHLHGYDVVGETGPGKPPAVLELVAGTPGRFALEAHAGWHTLARLYVTP